jgi:hypothetical protein
MTKDEALDLALEALEGVADWVNVRTKEHPWDQFQRVAPAITAIKQALALDKMAENARELGLDYEPVAWVDLLKQAEEVVRSKSLWKKYIDGTPLANDIAVWMASFAQEHATPPAQPAVPDAMTSADIQEHIEYVAGWNDCRQAMLEMMK